MESPQPHRGNKGSGKTVSAGLKRPYETSLVDAIRLNLGADVLKSL